MQPAASQSKIRLGTLLRRMVPGLLLGVVALVVLGLLGDLPLSLAVFTLSFSTVVGAVSALPGGLGAAEASIAGMLTLVGGIATATSSAATLLIRLATLWFGVGLGLGVWFFSKDFLGMQAENGQLSES